MNGTNQDDTIFRYDYEMCTRDLQCQETHYIDLQCHYGSSSFLLSKLITCERNKELRAEQGKNISIVFCKEVGQPFCHMPSQIPRNKMSFSHPISCTLSLLPKNGDAYGEGRAWGDVIVEVCVCFRVSARSSSFARPPEADAATRVLLKLKLYSVCKSAALRWQGLLCIPLLALHSSWCCS